MKFTSLKLTYFFKYAFPLLILIPFSINIIDNWNSDNEFLQSWAREAAFLTIFVGFWFSALSFKLRKVTVTESGITIHSPFKPDITVSFNNVEWVSQIAMARPSMIRLKINGHEEIIFMASEQTIFEGGSFFYNENKITQFIRNILNAYSLL